MLNRLIEVCVHRRTAAIFTVAILAAFGVRAYLNTPMVEGGLKPINVLYRRWPAPLADETP